MRRYTGWIPTNREIHRSFARHHLKVIRDADKEGHTEPVAQFESAIEADPEMRDLFNQIFLQAPSENLVCSQFKSHPPPALTIYSDSQLSDAALYDRQNHRWATACPDRRGR